MFRLNNLLSSRRFFLWTLLSYFLLLFVYNEKTYILTVLVYGVILFLFFKFNLLKTLYFTFLFVLPFQRGIRGWDIPVVQQGIEQWMRGYGFYFGLSLKFIFSIAVILIAVISTKDAKKKPSFFSWLLVSLFGWSLISTMSTGNAMVSWMGVLYLIVPISAYLVGCFIFQHNDSRTQLLESFTAILIFFGFIGTKQLIQQHAVGLFLEDNAFRDPSGFFTTDGVSMYRVSGLLGHPTYFGSYLSILILVVMGLTLMSFRQKKRISPSLYFQIGAILLGTLSLFGTLSRSAWASVVCTLSVLLYKHRDILQTVYRKIFFLIFILSFLIIIFYGPTLIERLMSLLTVWSQGTGPGRVHLMQQAIFQITRFPVFGVGLNRFTEIMAQQNLSTEIRSFLYPVHNTFLLLFSEIGIPGGILFAGFIFGILYVSFKKTKESAVNLCVWLGAGTFIINSQFQTLFHQDPSFDTLMVLLAFLSTL